VSAPSTMTCEQVSDLLTELVCGELDAESEANVRAHAASCATCAPELSALTSVLRVAESIPLDEPSPAVEQRIMQAAREAMSRKAGVTQALDTSTSPLTGFRAWFERLGAWAMSPQVAMASVLLLVVGIGLYALPFGEPSAPEALHLAQEPEAEAPAPTAAATAAPSESAAEEAVAEDVEATSARVAERGEGAPDQDLLEAMNAKPASRGGEKSQPADATYDAESRRKSAARSRPSGLPAAKPKAAAKDEMFGDDLGSVDGKGVGVATGTSGGGGSRYAPPPIEQQAEAKRDEAATARPAPAPFAEPAAAVAAEEAPASPSNASPSKESSKSVAGPVDFGPMLDQGLTASRSGDHARAVELLEPVVAKGPPALRASARPTLASSLRALGQCARALPHYAVLTKSISASRALLEEAADCYERVGNMAMARELRARAAPPNASSPATRD
jgi:hypothetical protein